MKVYADHGLRGMARVDFFLKESGRVVFNEINTLPGFTSISMYPQLWEASGCPYADLIDRLISWRWRIGADTVRRGEEENGKGKNKF